MNTRNILLAVLLFVVAGVVIDVILIGRGSGDSRDEQQPAIITVDPGVTYQTISGWEALAEAPQNSPAFSRFKDEVFDRLVNEAGVNRIRLELSSGVENTEDYWTEFRKEKIPYAMWRCLRYSTINDDSNSGTINWNGFHFARLDDTVEKIVLPLRSRLERNGESLYINLNYVAFTRQMTAAGCPSGLRYIHKDPEEYAEFILATFLHLRGKYGWVPDAVEVILEPDNVPEWDGKLIGRAIVTTAERLSKHGFRPEFIAPSNTNMGKSITYFDRAMAVPGASKYLREFSYHRYGGVSTTNLQTIANRAVHHGIRTSMLEWWNRKNRLQVLHEDLKIGRNSAWQQGAVAAPAKSNPPAAFYVVDDRDPARPVVEMGELTRFTRHYFKFVRAGAVRIQAVSSDTKFDPLAFRNLDGSYVVVVRADTGGVFSVRKLPSGTYGVRYTVGDGRVATRYDLSAPDQTIASGQELTTSIPDAGVVTVYAKR